jgi:hypothetical protein
VRQCGETKPNPEGSKTSQLIRASASVGHDSSAVFLIQKALGAASLDPSQRGCDGQPRGANGRKKPADEANGAGRSDAYAGQLQSHADIEN